MRIISGSRRGLRLLSPVGKQVRPTMDQVKEAAFNIVQFDIPDGVFLDMFSGSGQMACEALSRGADVVYCFEPDRQAFQTLSKNLEKMDMPDRVKAYNAPYSRLATVFPTPRVDVAYVDPPFESGMSEAALSFLLPFLHEGSTVICEAERGVELPERIGSFVDRPRKYGHVILHIYRYESEEEK